MHMRAPVYPDLRVGKYSVTLLTLQSDGQFSVSCIEPQKCLCVVSYLVRTYRYPYIQMRHIYCFRLTTMQMRALLVRKFPAA